jgi:hypothetical protein
MELPFIVGLAFVLVRSAGESDRLGQSSIADPSSLHFGERGGRISARLELIDVSWPPMAFSVGESLPLICSGSLRAFFIIGLESEESGFLLAGRSKRVTPEVVAVSEI